MSKRYDVEKITDIFQIPEDKFEDFLVDFRAYYQLNLGLMELIPEVAKVSNTNAKIQVVPQKLTWIDDGKHDAHVKFKTARPHKKGEHRE